MPKKILIIEDERPMAQALKLKLTHSHFETAIAYNGEDGLAILEKETFSLILLDLVMPRINGFSVLETLKEKKIQTPVIVLSNLSQKEDEKRARTFGIEEFFIKSDTPIATIIERIEQFLK
ncbi:response regulator [Candidatus Kuenenbacteria bacterium]|nr:response regulator [Candidatus Kuenenbacteria bacterium]